jgi:NCAIR mutase (PurE)-related protein
MTDLDNILTDLKKGKINIKEAALYLENAGVLDLGFAQVDHERAIRQAVPEAVLGRGKSPEQCLAIIEALINKNVQPVLLTRASHDAKELCLNNSTGAKITPTISDTFLLSWNHLPAKKQKILVTTGGTSDLPVANEAVATLEAFGFEVVLKPDCGIAGLQRVLSISDYINSADAIIVVAGMEAALASIIASLSRCPIISVPTSIGYGSSFEGITALLSMMSSCVPGVTVVGIDNGFGAAASIVRMFN